MPSTLNPRNADAEKSYNPHQPQFKIPRRVVKGGLIYCAELLLPVSSRSAAAADD